MTDKPKDIAVTTPPIVSTDDKTTYRRSLKNLAKSRLGLITLVVLVIVVIGLMSLSKFHRVTYNNGQGQTFSLKFYRRYYISKDFTTDDPVQAEHKGDANYKNAAAALASKVGVNKLYPLWMSISASPLDQLTKRASEKDKGLPCVGVPTVFIVYNASIKQKVSICNFGFIPNRPSYTGRFIYKQNLYYITITQVANNSALATKSSVGLSGYKNDLRTIVSSIKPL